MLGISEGEEASGEKPRRKKVTFTEFIPWATQLRNEQREEVRRHHGFSKDRWMLYTPGHESYAFMWVLFNYTTFFW